MITRDLDFTDPLRFPETTHHGLVVVRIGEVLPPSYVNGAIVEVVRSLQSDAWRDAIVIIEEGRLRRRQL